MVFFFSSRRRHTRYIGDWSSDVCSSDLGHQLAPRRLDYEAARRELMALPAIGPKIADCVCLFGLGHDAAVPVDTHVWQQIGRASCRRRWEIVGKARVV